MKKLEYTKYEKARIIGARALQLAAGAPCLIKAPKGITSAVTLAQLEFQKGVTPLYVIRENKSYF